MRGLHLAVSQAWRQPSLFVAAHACHAAGTTGTSGGGCGAGRSAAALLRHEQQQRRFEEGSSRLIPSDAELYYAYVHLTYSNTRPSKHRQSVYIIYTTSMMILSVSSNFVYNRLQFKQVCELSVPSARLGSAIVDFQQRRDRRWP